MAAYAALCSLMYVIDQIQNHPRPPAVIDRFQVESLTENVRSLQEFLEGYSHVGGYSKEADPLDSRIADAAHAAEDIIESHVVDRIHAGSGSASHRVKVSSIDFYVSLQKLIGALDSIKKEVMEITEKTGVRDQHHRNSTPIADSSMRSSKRQNTMVGFGEALLEMKDKLTGGQQYRQVITIVGMGGMGKTTLARNVYVSPLIQQYFDVCAWATISQEYSGREILREILCLGNKEELSDIEKLGVKLHKHLSGRRYLIVMDDMWSIEAWDEVSRFFPDYSNGSRIVITTRLSNVTSQLRGSYCLEMKFLDKDQSWNLLRKTVFGKKGCPLELEKIGKEIAQNCKGLPLSIVVIGGLLAKSKHSRKQWEYIAKNLKSLVNSKDNGRCLNILYMSYKQMPIYLKPCFLYMGIFSEDSEIRAKMLTKLWVAEGFLKPVNGKSLEEIAEECLEELIARNLIRASRCFGKVKSCMIHDLLRDLCLREAEKERFYYVMKEHSSNDSGVNTQRLIVIPKGKSNKEVVDELQSMSHARSLIREDGSLPQSLNFRLLRIFNACDKRGWFYLHPSLEESIFHFVNSRYLEVNLVSEFPSSVRRLWNLQTLIVSSRTTLTAPLEIWMMPQLRNVKFDGGLCLPDPPRRNIFRKDDDVVLSNLHSLSRVEDFKCSEEMIKRIPNVKKLGVRYYRVEGSSNYFLNNIHHLDKLESFSWLCRILPKPTGTDFLDNLTFPQSLKKLTLISKYVDWDQIMGKIGSLPFLEVLKLKGGYFQDCKWETVEDQFSRLKFLEISRLCNLKYWISESTHFPCLEQLVLNGLCELKEIPSGIGDIPTLESIEVKYCSYSVAISAGNMFVEQEELGNETIQFRVLPLYGKKIEALKSIESPKFQVQCK